MSRKAAWKASLVAGSARCARPVMPGAWLQTPANTRLISNSCDLFVGGCRHRVDARAHRSVLLHAVAHGLQVVGPGHAQQRRERSEERRVGKEGRSRWSPYH